MGPEQGAGDRTPTLDPIWKGARSQQVVGYLFGQIAFSTCMLDDPGQLSVSLAKSPHRRVAPSQQRRKQRPLTTSVIGVLQITVDSPVGERRFYRLNRAGHHRVGGINKTEWNAAGDQAGVYRIAPEPLRKATVPAPG